MSKPDNRWTWFDATMECIFNEGGCPIGNNRMSGAFLLFIVRRRIGKRYAYELGRDYS